MKSAVLTPEQAAAMPAKAVKVDSVETKLQVAQAAEVRRLASEIVVSTGELAGKYLSLCRYVRENKIPSKTVSRELTQLGFKRSRISEINRVCDAPDKVFTAFAAKEIGFQKAIDWARMEDGKGLVMTPAAKLLADKNIASQEDVEAGASAQSSSGAAPKNKTPLAQRLKASAKFIAINATRATEYKFADARFKVVVELVPKTKPAVGD